MPPQTMIKEVCVTASSRLVGGNIQIEERASRSFVSVVFEAPMNRKQDIYDQPVLFQHGPNSVHGSMNFSRLSKGINT